MTISLSEKMLRLSQQQASAVGGPVPPNPNSLTNIKLWSDAGDATTVTESGGFVTQWNDKSSNANHWIEFSSTVHPVYSNSEMVFDGATAGLRLTNSIASATFNVFYVMKTSATQWLMLFENTLQYFDFVAQVGSGSGPNSNYGNPELMVNAELKSSSTRDQVATALVTGDYLIAHHKNASTTSWSDFVLGYNPWSYKYNGVIKEIIYAGAMTTTEIEDMEGWLAVNNSLQSALPADHKYKNS